MVDRLTWNSILPKAVTGFSSQPLLSAETSYRLHQASCIHSAEWTFIYDVSHHSRFKHRPWHVHMLPSARRTVSVTAWMMTNRQLSFSEWWGLIVYVSAVGSAASAWAGRVSITFITCVGQLWDAGLILDWDTLIHTDKFYQAKTTRLVTLPLAPWHSSCQHLPHILC